MDAAAAQMREHVESLSRIDRRTTTSGERRSAEWVAARLAEAGARYVRLAPFRGPSTWAHALVAHAAVGLLASAVGARAGRLLALATIASYEADYTGRCQWMRRLLPRAVGHSVVARIPAAGPRRRTIVFAAHHDAAHGGLIWHPVVLLPYRLIARLTWRNVSYALPLYAALALVATARPALRRHGARGLAGVIAFAVQAARSRTTPGANDNATGVAALLELARRFATEPVPGLEVVVLSPGGEEVGVAGMRAWVGGARADLDPATTLVVGFDTLGTGEPVLPTRESLTATYRDEDLRWVDRGAGRAGLDPPRRTVLAVNTDAMAARHAGLPAVAILSMRHGWLGRFHRPEDTPETVDWGSVDRCLRLAHGTALAWATAPD